MKIIHTADWHIGQTFFGHERRHEHHFFLSWLTSQLKEREIDLLLVAGDIFDSPNPSAESQKIYYNFIREVTLLCPDLQIIITSGNHDSAARLEAPNPLLNCLNVTVRGVINRTADGTIDFDRLIIPIKDGGCCLAVPYLRQGDYPAADNHSNGVKELYDRLYKIASERYSPIIAMGHLQATGSEISIDDRNERTTIGGLDLVTPDFSGDNILYTALGHLHRAQRVSQRENMRYSGAPLPMSFAEIKNKQSVTMITIADGKSIIEKIPFDAPVKLLSIPSRPLPLEEVIEEIKKLPCGEITDESPFLEVRVLAEGADPTRRQQIEEALDGKAVRLARIVAVSPERKDSQISQITYDDLKKIVPMELAKIVYRQKYNDSEMPEEIEELLAKIIKEVEV